MASDGRKQRPRASLRARCARMRRLRLASLPNGRITSGSTPIRRIACTLFSRPITQSAAAAARPSGRARLRAASDRDQDHQREDDRAGRDKLAAQDARMHGDAAGQREGQRREQRNAPVAKDQAGQGRRRSARSRSRSGSASTRPARTACVIAASKAAASSLRHRRQASRRPAGRDRAAARNQDLTDRMVR